MAEIFLKFSLYAYYYTAATKKERIFQLHFIFTINYEKNNSYTHWLGVYQSLDWFSVKTCFHISLVSLNNRCTKAPRQMQWKEVATFIMNDSYRNGFFAASVIPIVIDTNRKIRLFFTIKRCVYRRRIRRRRLYRVNTIFFYFWNCESSFVFRAVKKCVHEHVVNTINYNI